MKLRLSFFLFALFCLGGINAASPAATLSDDCSSATDLNALIGGAEGVPQTSALQNNTMATAGTADANPMGCFFQEDPVTASLFYTFTGDGDLYDIVTTLCNATDSLPDGDTQFVLFSGTDCDSLTPVACNEDIAANDFRAGLFNILLEDGVTYYLLVDSYADVRGEFCLEFTNQGSAATCDDIDGGLASTAGPINICFNDTLSINIDDVVIVSGGDPMNFTGYTLVVSTSDISNSTDPFNEPSFLGGFGLQAAPSDVLYINNAANGLPPGATYFFTPVSYFNGVNTNNQLSGLDFTNGCIQAGIGLSVTLLDSLGQFTASVAVTPDPDMMMGGAVATATASGGSGSYGYAWSTGDSTATVDSLANGTYQVTVTDDFGCGADVVLTVEISDVAPPPYPDACVDAAAIDTLLGGPMGVAQTSTIYDNITATTDSTDDDSAAECFFEFGGPSSPFNATIWFTFTGDGLPYNLTTVQCGVGPDDYIDFGDTQFSLYRGNGCDSLEAVACGEDLDVGNNFFNANLNVLTEPGVTYYLLVDGFEDVTGQFCLQVTQMDFIGCDQIDASTITLQTGVDYCPGDDISITLDSAAVIPQIPTDNIFTYLISSQDISFATDAAAIDAVVIGNTEAEITDYDFVETTDIFNGFTGTFFITPVVVSGIVGPVETLSDLDTTACFDLGNSVAVNINPAVELELEGSTTPANEAGGSADGTATVTVTGGSGNYTYAWSNGGDTETITDLTAGEYTVTVTENDLPCAEPVELTVTVDFVSGVNDPTLTAAVRVFPNPTSGLVNLRYDFGENLDLQVQLTNGLGQLVLSRRLTDARSGNLPLDLDGLPAGFYHLRLTDGVRQAVKPLVIR